MQISKVQSVALMIPSAAAMKILALTEVPDTSAKNPHP